VEGSEEVDEHSENETYLIADANGLIDFIKVAPEVLKILASRMYSIQVPIDLLQKVLESVSREDAEELGLHVYIPEFEEYLEARSPAGALSEIDSLCLAIASNKNWPCLTNDKPLRRELLHQGL